MLLRLVTVALCATCVVLLATFPPIRIAVVSPGGLRDRGPPGGAALDLPVGMERCGPPAGAAINVVDVAPGVAPAQIAALIQLSPGEHISAIDDRAPASDLEAGALLASLTPHPGAFLDVTVSSATTQRRVLVLLH